MLRKTKPYGTQITRGASGPFEHPQQRRESCWPWSSLEVFGGQRQEDGSQFGCMRYLQLDHERNTPDKLKDGGKKSLVLS